MKGTIITKSGIALIAKLLASKQQLVFTRAAVGTGAVPAGYDPGSMVNLNQYKMDAEISGYSAEGEEATVVFQISSVNIEEGFIITEAGLFAEDADQGEILYAYLDLTDDPQYVYAKNSLIQKFAEIEFKTLIGSIENMTVIMSPGALVTREEFDEAIERKIESEEGDISDTIVSEMNDFSAEGSEVPDARDAIKEIIKGKKLSIIISNIKAALMGLVTLGEMRGLLVNNGLCAEPGRFFLDAAYGKNLQDQITQLNSKIMTTTVKTYTPVFAWSQGGTPPTVKNVEATYAVMAKCCFIEARYVIESLGNPASNENLIITLPNGIKPAFNNVCMVSRYQTMYEQSKELGIRMNRTNNLIYLVREVGGDYISTIISTGLQGFSAMFLIE